MTTPDRDVNVCRICKVGKQDTRPKRGANIEGIFICDDCIGLLGGYDIIGEIARMWE
jgi:hypothetical protein